MEATREDTLGDETPSPPDGARRSRPWLIYLGSAENAFRGAGAVWALDGVRTVRFGRGSGDDVESERLDEVLHVSIPLGWVSSTHAEMRVITASAGSEFDLRDLGSRNGTHIEQAPVPGIARLGSGQVFEIGRSFWMARDVERDLPADQVKLLDPEGTASPGLCAIHRTLARLARSQVPLLLHAETGTGKETTARAVHRISGRTGPFLAVNLAAWNDERVDSMLFGYQRGAFPGAEEDSPGLFEQAHGGTVYLAELGELSPLAQSKLHAALADGRVTRLGDHTPREFDVRVVGSTLHDLHGMVEHGTFRPDLYSRLAGFTANMPPLRERREDLGVLTMALCQTRNGNVVRVATRAFRRILAHNWPFNVRELGQTLATASILAGTGGEITREVLEEILERRRDMPSSPEVVSQLRAKLVSQLAKSGGNTAEVARALDRDQKEIHRWLERFDLEPDAYRR